MRRAVFVGRFQPFHLGHLHAVKEILEAYEEVIIAIGSAQYSHTFSNPFTAGERIEMIRAALRGAGIDLSRVITSPVPDIGEHSLWVDRLKSFLPRFEAVYTNNPFVKLLLTEKGVKVVEPKLVDREVLNATFIRSLMLKDESWKDLVQREVWEFIESIDGVNRMKVIAESEKKDSAGS